MSHIWQIKMILPFRDDGSPINHLHPDMTLDIVNDKECTMIDLKETVSESQLKSEDCTSENYVLCQVPCGPAPVTTTPAASAGIISSNKKF